VAGRATPGERGGLPRGGGWPEARTRLDGGVPRPAGGSGATPGAGLMGGQPGRRTDDEEHYRRYGRDLDSDELFDVGLSVSRPVIGVDPDDDPDDDPDES
jgi:hypothetical protein